MVSKWTFTTLKKKGWSLQSDKGFNGTDKRIFKLANLMPFAISLCGTYGQKMEIIVGPHILWGN